MDFLSKSKAHGDWRVLMEAETPIHYCLKTRLYPIAHAFNAERKKKHDLARCPE